MTHEERVSYVEALMYISTIDEKIEEEEFSYFSQVGQIYGIEVNELEKIKENLIRKEKSIEEILKPIVDRKTQLTLTYELLALCYIDGSYDILEKQGMTKICSIMGVEESKLLEIESSILENIELQKKINTVLERD